MARLRSFKRTRRSGDADPSAGTEPGLAAQTSSDEQAALAPELPPGEIVSEEPPANEEPQAEVQDEAKARSGLRKGKKARPPRPPVANLSRVRRERRALMHERERRIRDLGGLMLEMYRRDQFREDLIVEHCAQAMGVENRIHELESILMRATSRRATPGPQCSCGAPLLFGARFCASCGRPTELAADEQCAHCGQPVAAGASFCAACGTAVDAGGSSAGPDENSEQTMEHAPPAAHTEAVEQVEGGEA
ncbi:MAG: zinc ribbon domain-containing protein [Gaiellaceae bacterium]